MDERDLILILKIDMIISLKFVFEFMINDWFT